MCLHPRMSTKKEPKERGVKKSVLDKGKNARKGIGWVRINKTTTNTISFMQKNSQGKEEKQIMFLGPAKPGRPVSAHQTRQRWRILQMTTAKGLRREKKMRRAQGGASSLVPAGLRKKKKKFQWRHKK